MEYDLLPPSNDYVFANLFGKKNHERILVCLLNAILNGNPYIKSVKLDPTEYKKTSPNGKSIRLDIAATSDDGTILNIEVQCSNEGNIIDRASFYKAKVNRDHLKEGENYSSIPNIISIWICTESETHRKGCCHEIIDMFKDNGIDPIEPASEKMRQIIIELTKTETISRMFLNKMFAVWMQFIKDPNSIPAEFLSISEVQEAMNELQYMSADPQTRAEYDARVKQLNDMRAAQSVKYNEGLAEGEKIGIEKGKAEGEKIGIEKGKAEERAKAHVEKVEMAKKLILTGLNIEQVSQITGLSIDELKDE